MKRFSRTVLGKTAFFLAFVLFFCIFAASVVGAYGLITYDFYSQPEEEMLRSRVVGYLSEYAYNYASYTLNGTDTGYGDKYVQYRLSRGGETLGETDRFSDFEAANYETHEYVVYAYRSEDGTHYNVYWTPQYEEDTPIEYYAEYDTATDTASSVEIFAPAQKANGEKFTVTILAHPDYYRVYYSEFELALCHLGYTLRYAVYPIGIAAAILCVILYVALICAAGKKPDTEELSPGILFAVPYDLLFVCGWAALIVWILAWSNAGVDLIALVTAVILTPMLFLGLSMSFASRVKQHELWHHMLIYHIGRLIVKICRYLFGFWRNIRLVPKCAIAIAVVSVLELFFFSNFQKGGLLLLWFIEKLIFVPAIFYIAISLRRLQVSGEKLASGDLEYHTDEKKLIWDFKKHAENLNSISEGMKRAVNEKTKSERMKTELITNVSHDIKTPLTSVINYAGLIAAEPCENENIVKYCEVLTRQSEKLKRLIEDLIEASKASSGNLDVSLSHCSAGVFIAQVCGEYDDKLKNAGLSAVTRIPEEEIFIRADSRRMMRVFDNLMNNICKYSQAGTRVYLTLETVSDNAVITFKNTSREALDISADELTERFVRGDKSRTEDGSGLGLAIAKSFTELQGGKFDVEIDGDLFKAILTFPILR